MVTDAMSAKEVAVLMAATSKLPETEATILVEQDEKPKKRRTRKTNLAD